MPCVVGGMAVMPTMAKVCVAFMDGEPSSVTTIVNVLVEPDGPETVQLKAPVLGLMAAPAGGLAPRLKVNVLVGISWSDAEAVKVTVVPIKFVRLAMAASTGALFTSPTTTVKLLVALLGGTPLSATTTVTV